jgi:hypothetical protein
VRTGCPTGTALCSDEVEALRTLMGGRSMLRKAFILLLMVALLWLSSCGAVAPVTDPGAHFGPCAQKMPYYYCGN